MTELARKFGYNPSHIHKWVNEADGGGKANGIGASNADAPLTVSEHQEFQELRRKLKQVQMERDILAMNRPGFRGSTTP